MINYQNIKSRFKIDENEMGNLGGEPDVAVYDR